MYKVLIYCPDCLGDPMGCFGGFKEPLTDKDGTVVEFKTIKEATLAGWKETDDNIYRFTIVDENRNVITPETIFYHEIPEN